MSQVSKTTPIETISGLIMAMCGDPQKVKVTETSMTRSVTYSVVQSHRDFPRIIGSGAVNFRALELLVKIIVANEFEKEGILSVAPPDNTAKPPEAKFKPNREWGRAQLEPLVKSVCKMVFGSGAVEIVDPDAISTNIEVKVDSDHRCHFIEGQQQVNVDPEVLEAAFRTIFKAIGKNNGRNVHASVVGVYYPKPTWKT